MRATRAFCRALTLATVLFMGASSAGAAIYTVTLTNGTSFETRYRPATPIVLPPESERVDFEGEIGA